MAESRIIHNLLRRWTASVSEEVFVVVIGKTAGESTSLLLHNSGRVLLHKVIVLGLVVRPVWDGGFMVKVAVGGDGGDWSRSGR
jgi:glycosyltransferase A (GT-A) superfamily protein (DUF2064 family)